MIIIILIIIILIIIMITIIITNNIIVNSNIINIIINTMCWQLQVDGREVSAAHLIQTKDRQGATRLLACPGNAH